MDSIHLLYYDTGRYQIKEAIRTAGRVLSVRYYKDKGVLLPLVNEIIAMVEKANEQSNPCDGCTKPCEKCLGCQKNLSENIWICLCECIRNGSEVIKSNLT